MVFVTIGTERFSFDRLIKEIDRLAEENKINDSVFVQLGFCKYEPKNCQWKRFLSFDEMVENIKKADLVISHAASTFFVCLQNGKKPILVPREKKFKEHLDDHQVIFAEKMKALGYDRVIFDVSGLGDLYERVSEENSRESQELKRIGSPELVDYLNNLILSWS